jgi:hypothetical protein
MGCKKDEIEAGKACWEVQMIEATVYQGSNCVDQKRPRTRITLDPADRRVRAAIKDALGKHKTPR